ncbi:hypothetical protein ACFFUS_11620 [Vibrio gallaecicus]|uniref:hypothetical protein n=1 Tax=Vibrio gallaecicus TaxID=552386 RepID=UPI0010C94870|nr:hypothetical protein [Vibrio gallaecicus]MDN3617177.1 hypothetical protein [Vibrio gallaecicus]
MKPEIIEEHTDLVKFYDQCDWAWKIHILMKTYCNTEELIGWCSLDKYLGVILNEYAVLQIAKLHDNAEAGSNKNHSLLFIAKSMASSVSRLCKTS